MGSTKVGLTRGRGDEEHLHLLAAEVQQPAGRQVADSPKGRGGTHQKDDFEQKKGVEFENFENFWNEKLEKYDQDAKELEEKFVANQEREKQDFEGELDQMVQAKVRPSPKLLNMEYRIEQLSKYQRFEEAAKLQDQYQVEVRVTSTRGASRSPRRAL